MSENAWIAIGIAAITIANGWCQFFVKEVLLAKNTSGAESVAKLLISKSFLLVIAITGIISALSLWFLYKEVSSTDPLNRISCLLISVWCVLCVLNMFFVQSLVGIRRFSILRKEIEESEQRANEQSRRNAILFG